MTLKIENLDSKNNIRVNITNGNHLAKVPDHVKVLRDVILDFHGTIQQQFNLKDDQNVWDVQRKPAWEQRPLSERNAIMEMITDAENTQRVAKKHEKDKVDEDPWSKLFYNSFFHPLYQRFQPKPMDSRYVSRQKYFYDSFELHGEKYWNLFCARTGYRAEDRIGLTKPKLDFGFYFTVHYTRTGMYDATPASSHEEGWKHAAQGNLAKNFSFDILDQLSEAGLKYTPLYMQGEIGDTVQPKNMQCFPWLIVELKKGDDKEAEHCYCQAANASAAALMLLQTVSRYADDKYKFKHVPPVVAVTGIGKKVRVWITHYTQWHRKDAYEMNYIWEGDMTNVLDILKFHAILENLHSWAMRILKPQLMMYIDQWKHRILASDHQIKEESMARLVLKKGNISVDDLTNLFEVAIRKTRDMGLHHSAGCNHDELLDSIQDPYKSKMETHMQRLEHIIEDKDSYKSDMEKHMQRLEHIIEDKFASLKVLQGVEGSISQTQTATLSLRMPRGTRDILSGQITQTTEVHGNESSVSNVGLNPTQENRSLLSSAFSPRAAKGSRTAAHTEAPTHELSEPNAKLSTRKVANIFAATSIMQPELPKPPSLFGAGVDNTNMDLNWISPSMFGFPASSSSPNQGDSAHPDLDDGDRQLLSKSKGPLRPLFGPLGFSASGGSRNTRSESPSGSYTASNPRLVQPTISLLQKFETPKTHSARSRETEKKDEAVGKSNEKNMAMNEEDETEVTLEEKTKKKNADL